MKKADEIRIGGAMNRRLSALEASAERRARIRQRIEREEEPKVKRKLTAAMAFALVAVMALSGIALAAGMNLFEMYDEEDTRLTGLSASAVLEEVTSVTIETEELGRTTAVVTNAYYDGVSLIVGYSLENMSAFAEYELSEGDLQNKRLIEAAPEEWGRGVEGLLTEKSAESLKEIVERCKQGEPFGFVMHLMQADGGAFMTDGTFLPGSTENDWFSEGDTRYYVREFETPLPEAAQNLDSLHIRIGLAVDSSYFYFDGEALYSIPIPAAKEVGGMTAVVLRSESAVRNFTGEGEIDGAKVTAEAWLTPVYGWITLKAEERVLDMQDPILGEYRAEIYRVFIADAEGKVENTLRTDRYRLTDDLLGMEIGFSGSGEAEVTDHFTVCLMHWDDMQDYWGYEDVLEKAVLIEMKSAE